MGRFVALYWGKRRAPFTHRLTPCWAGLQSQRPLRMIGLERQAGMSALEETRRSMEPFQFPFPSSYASTRILHGQPRGGTRVRYTTAQ